MCMRLTPGAFSPDHRIVFTPNTLLSTCILTPFLAADKTINTSTSTLQKSRIFQYTSSRCFTIFIFTLLCIIPDCASTGNDFFQGHYSTVHSSRNLSYQTMNKTLYHDQSRGRSKETQYAGRHQLSQDLIEFVCDKISDPCLRAAFLRLRTYHRICTQVPLIYLLPYVSDTIRAFVLPSLPQPHCNGVVSGLQLRSSDGLYSQFLLTRRICRLSLFALDNKILATVDTDEHNFVDMLSRSFCSYIDRPKNRTGDFDCDHCRKAYSSWLCSTMFPIFYPVDHQIMSRILESNDPPHSQTISFGSVARNNSSNLREKIDQLFSQHPYQFVIIPACKSWCTAVETLCPYLHPDDATSMGGEPTFQCGGNWNQGAFISETKSEQYCCFNQEELFSDSTDLIHLLNSQSIKQRLYQGTSSPLQSRCFCAQVPISLVPHNDSNKENFLFHLGTIRPAVPNPAQCDAYVTRFSSKFIFAMISLFSVTIS